MPGAAAEGRSRAWLVAVVLSALLLAAVFAGLGTWQLQRLAWKEDLLARIERGRSGDPQPAPGPDDWPALAPARDEYRRVATRGRYAHAQSTRVRASTVYGSGYWVLTPLLTDSGWWLLVNRGFVPQARPGDAAPAAIDEPTGEQPIVGLLRFSEPGGSMLQSNEPQQDRWYSRDVAAIAAARGFGTTGANPQPVAPYFVDAVAPAALGPAAPTAWPRPGLTVLNFSNNHRGYAATWYVLSVMVLAAAGYVLHTERRPRAVSAPDRP